MPKFQKLTRDRLPQYLDDSAEDHNGHGWETLDSIMQVGIRHGYKIRARDIADLYGVDVRTAGGWIDLYLSKNNVRDPR